MSVFGRLTSDTYEMLDSLNDQTIGPYRLHLENLGRTRYFDQRDFTLYLVNPHANNFTVPIFRGRYNLGRPSIYVPGWIDGEFVEVADLATSSEDTRLREMLSLAEEIAKKLGALIPPGGRFWIAYEAFDGEGELARGTRAGLTAGVPLLTTPIGFLLYRADCWLGLRDWLFPEGGREGPRKLQGNKALNAEHARQRASEIVPVLENFLEQPARDDIERRAQQRAEIILPPLKTIASTR